MVATPNKALRMMLYRVACRAVAAQHGVAFLLKQLKQFLHMFLPGPKVHWIDPKPGFALELSGGHPEAPALLDSLRDFGMQVLRVRLARLGSFKPDTNGRHRWTGNGFELGVVFDESMQVFRLAHVIV